MKAMYPRNTRMGSTHQLSVRRVLPNPPSFRGTSMLDILSLTPAVEKGGATVKDSAAVRNFQHRASAFQSFAVPAGLEYLDASHCPDDFTFHPVIPLCHCLVIVFSVSDAQLASKNTSSPREIRRNGPSLRM